MPEARRRLGRKRRDSDGSDETRTGAERLGRKPDCQRATLQGPSLGADPKLGPAVLPSVRAISSESSHPSHLIRVNSSESPHPSHLIRESSCPRHLVRVISSESCIRRSSATRPFPFHPSSVRVLYPSRPSESSIRVVHPSRVEPADSDNKNSGERQWTRTAKAPTRAGAVGYEGRGKPAGRGNERRRRSAWS